jgi:hypothetical protein
MQRPRAEVLFGWRGFLGSQERQGDLPTVLGVQELLEIFVSCSSLICCYFPCGCAAN